MSRMLLLMALFSLILTGVVLYFIFKKNPETLLSEMDVCNTFGMHKNEGVMSAEVFETTRQKLIKEISKGLSGKGRDPMTQSNLETFFKKLPDPNVSDEYLKYYGDYYGAEGDLRLQFKLETAMNVCAVEKYMFSKRAAEEEALGYSRVYIIEDRVNDLAAQGKL